MYNLNDINFILGQGGSGRQANGTDYIGAMMFFNNTRPALMGADNFASGSVRQIFSSGDAVALGITNDYSDETKATCKIVIGSAGITSNAITMKVTEWTGGSGKSIVTLGTYTNLSSDSIATFVTGLTAAINANTSTHGYTAVETLSTTVTVTARAGMGIYFNSGSPYTIVATGTATGTITQNVIPGVASKLAVYYYHIARYFKMKPDGTLYIGIFNSAGNSTFADLANIMTYSKGAVSFCGIWDDTQTFALTSLTKIQAVITGLRPQHYMLSNVVYAADIKAISGGLITLAGASYNLATLSDNNVSALIDNDGNGKGFDLYNQTGKTISSLGACIGCISESAISEDIGNPVTRFNPDDGTEFDTLMFGNGEMYNTVSYSLLNSLNNNRYIYLSKIMNTTGSFYSDDHTAIAYTSDYAWIHDNRVIDRVIKDIFSAMVPFLKSKLKLQTNGTMTAQQIAILVSAGGEVIKPLIASEDLAGDPDSFTASQWILVNPLQKPNVTGKLIVAVKIAANAIAHSIEIPIGFGTF